MGIPFRCEMCGKSLNVPLKFAGKLISCPKCGEELPVPEKHVANPFLSAGFITAAVVSSIILIGLGFFIGVIVNDKPMIEEKIVEVEKPVEKIIEVEIPVEGTYEFDQNLVNREPTDGEQEYFQKLNDVGFRATYPDVEIAVTMKGIEVFRLPNTKWEYVSTAFDVELSDTDGSPSFPAHMMYAMKKTPEGGIDKLVVIDGYEFKDYMMNRSVRLKNKRLGL